MHTPTGDAIVLAIGAITAISICITFYRNLGSFCRMAERVGAMPLDIDLRSF